MVKALLIPRRHCKKQRKRAWALSWWTAFDEEWQMADATRKGSVCSDTLAIISHLDGLVYQKPPGILTFLGTPAIESPGVAEKDLEPGQRVGGSVWMSSMMMVGSCIILNCCNSKIAKCFILSPEHECVLLFSALADCPFNRSTITCFSRSTLQVFQEEVPRAKARQQLREAQNNDASRGLGEETGLRGVKIQGPPNPLIQVLHPWRNAIYNSAWTPQKSIQQLGFRRITPLEMSKSSHLLTIQQLKEKSSDVPRLLIPWNLPTIRCPARRHCGGQELPAPRGGDAALRGQLSTVEFYPRQPSMASFLWGKIFIDHPFFLGGS